ncbi:MAG: aldehyde dehydrogenase family protein [Fimbriimonadaceae bacterium]|nr:aldehyde dehydrogenase family protein [Chthonomonadaceae bacterium]MCO5296237.1 aldehyde dehydrogenase family protein [Fimbriimonadaceae bacterium]
MENAPELLSRLHVDLSSRSGEDLVVTSPIDGSALASLRNNSAAEVDHAIARASQAFHAWRDVPAPRRGELVRLFGEELRSHKEDLARLVTLECGKILEEGRGEVQEMIDICDFAVGLSRQLYGLTIASERPNHSMQENWLPLGPIGVISAFNFPVAVWAWNATLAFVCGDPVVWKPSEKTPLTALACQALFERACKRFGAAPDGLSSVVLGDATVGNLLVSDRRLPLISATGSTRMGRAVGPKVAERFGRALLELGGNNAVIVSQRADLDLAMPSILFGAIGTAGQRCTSTRRVIVHRSIADTLYQRLKGALSGVVPRIGDPLDPRTLVGPLIDKDAYTCLEETLAEARRDARELIGGERMHAERWPDAYYVRPALALMPNQTAVVERETFAPLTYLIPYDTLEEALEIHNAVPQGLSSAIMTTDLREAEYFKRRSDCGIANVNIGTSGAEIGGAFGGEKETGGGRESGSDAWKAYMRRQTSTTYFGTEKPALAQGITFE